MLTRTSLSNPSVVNDPITPPLPSRPPPGPSPQPSPPRTNCYLGNGYDPEEKTGQRLLDIDVLQAVNRFDPVRFPDYVEAIYPKAYARMKAVDEASENTINVNNFQSQVGTWATTHHGSTTSGYLPKTSVGKRNPTAMLEPLIVSCYTLRLRILLGAC